MQPADLTDLAERSASGVWWIGRAKKIVPHCSGPMHDAAAFMVHHFDSLNKTMNYQAYALHAKSTLHNFARN